VPTRSERYCAANRVSPLPWSQARPVVIGPSRLNRPGPFMAYAGRQRESTTGWVIWEGSEAEPSG